MTILVGDYKAGGRAGEGRIAAMSQGLVQVKDKGVFEQWRSIILLDDIAISFNSKEWDDIKIMKKLSL